MDPILLLFIATILGITTAQECSIPNTTVLTTLLNSSLIDNEGIDPAELTNLTITNQTFTCLATSEFIHKYETLAVVLEYKINATSVLEYAYIDAECIFDGYPNVIWSVLKFEGADESYLNLNVRVDCYRCNSFLNDHHCSKCHSSCGGSGRCFGGNNAADCCPVFDNGVCDSGCPDKFAPDENDFYQCVCNISCPAGYEPDLLCDECNYTSICLAEEPCENGGQCILDDSPTDYYCECTEYSNGTNCTDCNLYCEDGYSPNPTCSQCNITDICLALSPCTNGGTCVLTTPPDSYNCTCINHYEPSSNCTNCALNCMPGYAPDTDCTECVLSDICEASMPCQNGGTCILGPAPDSYSCTCTNHYEPSSNCTNCALNCMPGFTLDADCTECVLSDICEAFIPCQNGGTCILTTPPDSYSCTCINHYEPSSNCANCTLKCSMPGYAPDTNCTECVLNDICKASMPCQNGGTCILGSAPDQFSCNCHNNFDSSLNCSECSLTCDTGFVTDDDCFECKLSNLCLAMNPCANNGSCSILNTTALDQYQCDCHYNETGYSGTNCTECSISCTRGYAVVEKDGRCICQPEPSKSSTTSTNFRWWMAFIPAIAVLLIVAISICIPSLYHQFTHKKKLVKIAPI